MVTLDADICFHAADAVEVVICWAAMSAVTGQGDGTIYNSYHQSGTPQSFCETIITISSFDYDFFPAPNFAQLLEAITVYKLVYFNFDWWLF